MFGLGSVIVTAIAYIAVGVCFCIFKAGILSWLMTVVGLLFIIQGVIKLTNKPQNQTEGIVSVVIGAVVLLGGWLFVKLAMLSCGVILVIWSVMGLTRQNGSQKNTAVLYNILTLIAGVCLVISPWAMLDWLFVVTGVLFILKGAFAFMNEKPL